MLQDDFSIASSSASRNSAAASLERSTREVAAGDGRGQQEAHAQLVTSGPGYARSEKRRKARLEGHEHQLHSEAITGSLEHRGAGEGRRRGARGRWGGLRS